VSWRPLARFRDPTVPKLANLRRAARTGLSVPHTVWLPAAGVDLERVAPPAGIGAPWMVRSASPSEDTDEGTAAGKFVSQAVAEHDPDAFRDAVRAVVASLPREQGKPRGAVFVQPLLAPERGGVAFFDGFYFECTTAPGGNRALTSGLDRGAVERGELRRGDPFSDWLKRVGRVFRRELAGAGTLDIEFARDGDAFTLLQARPARFALRRNPRLSLANHREILGDPPSPWVVSALERAGAGALRYFAEVDPEVGRWNERYAWALGGRAWLNFSFFFRLMDHWGLPRAFVTQGVGGQGDGPLDARIDLARFLRMGPRLIRLQLKNLVTVLQSARDLAAFERRVRAATDLRELHAATVVGLSVALRTNFAINGALTGATRVRRALGLRGRARVTTEALMEQYDALRRREGAGLEAGLDAWLATYGHRGPLESDPARPRFAELREVLLADLARGRGPAAAEPPRAAGAGGRGLWFALDRRRESFRDELMRVWQELRRRILAAAAREGLEPAEDVFLLGGKHLAGGARPGLEVLRAELDRLARIELPDTARREEIEERLAGVAAARMGDSGVGIFRGVALSQASFEGRVRRADDLVHLLEAERRAGHALVDSSTVLVVPALEPAWAVVFGRVGAVVTELGGELSHASILLREAGKPAIVNCRGVFGELVDNERVRLDGARGVVERIA
jgi:pyruvate,water dikinase